MVEEVRFEQPDVRASRLQIERGAISEIWCSWPDRDEPYGASEGEIECSKAISLKRIADALSGVGENAFTQSLNHYGENIGQCIQGQFERIAR